MKILHTSDWHIGRQLHGISLLEDQRHILNEIFNLCKNKSVEVLLIAGDIYDRSVPPANAVELLDQFLTKVKSELNIPVILISGNHDGPERLGFGSNQMKNSGLHIVGPLQENITPTIISDEFGEVFFYGLPYADPVQVRDKYNVDFKNHDEAMGHLVSLVKDDYSKRKQERTVVLSHCFIDGAEECESERPLSIGGADRVSYKHFESFNYTALGHLHGRQFKGKENIRYSGTPLKYSFSETKHRKSVTLVDLKEDGSIEFEQIELSPLRDLRVIEGELNDILEAAKSDQHRDDYIMARILDKHAILDLMAKLRAVYPNTLHLERPSLSSDHNIELRKENLKKSEFSMFQDFFEQVLDEKMNKQQQEYMESVINALHGETRE
ncbi:exonuclease SbcCD subunit D [Halobacteriovorax sp. GB3]|uniref:exonuclease SbcCD subunit D n=1 Tax=Halobacteriovorax sp. GB3 TaxID=2719615 RepID=UPI00235F3B62|nr:exonuclease SbcCD subunit D [Halobacteriovorax sp. GB3]MDD0851754.1 exonuclease SbcCD subunit D [Halobacteriovorax sp. GB3]